MKKYMLVLKHKDSAEAVFLYTLTAARIQGTDAIFRSWADGFDIYEWNGERYEFKEGL